MASKINADEFVDREGEDKPTLPKGVVLSGVTTITTAVVAGNEVANSTGINAGIITSTHFKGNLTGDVNAGIVTVSSQTVIGSGVTISASGIDIGAGVITATSYAGSGANLTGLGATIMTWEYNPDPSTHVTAHNTGIGITFNQKIKAGSGNITIRETSASGTVVENFGIGSSVTIGGNSLEFTPTSALGGRKVYHISLPAGVITNMAGESYVGTAYTFSTAAGTPKFFVWGPNHYGMLGLNQGGAAFPAVVGWRSSPTQLPGTTWDKLGGPFEEGSTTAIMAAIKTDGTLWTWGRGTSGGLGHNNTTNYSSPTQVPGTTWNHVDMGYRGMVATKTDGTLWSWGYNGLGTLGQNNLTTYSSPKQIPGTTWSTGRGKATQGQRDVFAHKTDGTLWVWGNNYLGQLGLNQAPSVIAGYSSPVQLPGTTWEHVEAGQYHTMGSKTDGTLWGWGNNGPGILGLNDTVQRSSPTQIFGGSTDWKPEFGRWTIGEYVSHAIKTDGTLWGWGNNNQGGGWNGGGYSSPVQVGSDTNWNYIASGHVHTIATKTDGTLWAWGSQAGEAGGGLGLNNETFYSSPVQVGSGTMWTSAEVKTSGWSSFALLEDTSS